MAETLGLFDSVAVTARSMTTEHFTDPDDDWEPILFVEGKTGTGMTPLGQFMRNDDNCDSQGFLQIQNEIVDAGCDDRV